MANVSVYNMEGKEVDKIELSDAVFGVEVNEHIWQQSVRELRKQRHVLRFLAAEENRGDRKEPDMLVRVQQELRSGLAAA